MADDIFPTLKTRDSITRRNFKKPARPNLDIVFHIIRIRRNFEDRIINGGGDRFCKWTILQLWSDLDIDLDLQSGQRSYRRAYQISRKSEEKNGDVRTYRHRDWFY